MGGRGGGYTDFLQFAFWGDLARYYGDHRWSGWEREVVQLPGDRAFHFMPMLCMKSEGGMNARGRKAVPIEELWVLHAHDLPRQRPGAASD